MERVQGSSDAVVEKGSVLDRLTLSAGLAVIAPGNRRFETSFQLSADAARMGSGSLWTMTDGGDIIQIQPAYSTGGIYFSTAGFDVKGDVLHPSQYRYVTVRDKTSADNPAFRRQMYRLQVTRVPGPP